MRIQSFQQMLSDYRIDDLAEDDKKSREEKLLTHPYSVIIEGGVMEFDNLDSWIQMTLGQESINSLFYGKTGYDFGFAEYFFTTDLHAKMVEEITPRIYTIYPYSNPPNLTEKSNGYDEHIAYDPKDEQAIVITPKQQS